MTKQEKADWKAKKDLLNQGWDVRPSAVRLHSSTETPKHLMLKTLIARELQRQNRRWDTEVRGPNGRVDVLDLGPPDESPLAYEVQTNATKKDRQHKAAQYCDGVVRDVIFLDPTDAPDEISQLVDWVADRVV